MNGDAGQRILDALEEALEWVHGDAPASIHFPDGRVLELTRDQYVEMMRTIHDPPPASPELKRLMRRLPIWKMSHE